MQKNITVIGGDLRSVELAKILKKDGYNVTTFGLEKSSQIDESIKAKSLEDAIKFSKIIVGPTPLTKDSKNIFASFSENEINLEQTISNLSGKTFIAGGIKPNIYNLSKDVEIIDLLQQEELSIYNAIATAEGAIQTAIQETGINIHGSNVLVMGFGRIGKILSKMLDGIGSKVYCEARKKEDLAWIKAYSYNAIPLENLEENLEKFDIIFNTIPYVILNKEYLQKTKKDVTIIDLASAPGGVDIEAIKELDKNYILAAALPGKVSPITSAEYIKQTLENIITNLASRDLFSTP